MVYNYIKKTNRQSWSTEQMEQAVQAVVSCQLGYAKASRQFNVPQTTLERYVKKRKENPEGLILKTMGSKKSVFNPDEEAELVDYLKKMEERLFGLTMTECRKLAFQLAEQNGHEHPFNKNDEAAGRGWMNGFLKRHPELSIRKPEATSGARAMGFNKVAVSRFFKLLTEIVDKYKITAERIGLSKILATKGKRQVGAVTSAERGETVTVEVCFSAGGSYIPPTLIFPRKRLQQGFLEGLVPGGSVELNEKGWIDMDIFFNWFKKFVIFSHASKETPVLLLLDGHASHTKNLNVINYARDHGVILLCFPPHCTHRLQPLDVSFMKPLSVYYDDEIRKWLRSNPGRVVTLHQISSLFSAAYLRAATMTTALNGFKKNGVWPVDMSIFSDADFLPSDTTDISFATNIENEQFEPRPRTSTMRETTPENDITNDIGDPLPGVSGDKNTSFRLKSPQAIIPIPKVSGNTKRVSRKRGKTAILTDSPYKNTLEEAAAKKMKSMSKGKKKLFSLEKTAKKATKKSVQKKRKRTAKEDSDDSSNGDSSDCECLYCQHLYSNSTEGWISCSVCHKWAHNSCAGTESEDDEAIHVCKFCE
jgi:transposase-like protein